MNRLYSELGGSKNPGIQNLKSVMKKLKTLDNPTQTLSDLAQTNPSIKQILLLAQNKNMSLKYFYYMLAKEKGVDPEDILNQLKDI